MSKQYQWETKDLFFKDLEQVGFLYPPKNVASKCLSVVPTSDPEFPGIRFALACYWNALCYFSKAEEPFEDGSLAIPFEKQIKAFKRSKSQKEITAHNRSLFAHGFRHLMDEEYTSQVGSWRWTTFADLQSFYKDMGTILMWQAIETLYYVLEEDITRNPNSNYPQWTLGQFGNQELLETTVFRHKSSVFPDGHADTKRPAEYDRLLLRSLVVCHPSEIQAPQYLPSIPDGYMIGTRDDRALLFLESAFEILDEGTDDLTIYGPNPTEVENHGIEWVNEITTVSLDYDIKAVLMPPYSPLKTGGMKAQALIFTPLGMFVQEFFRSTYSLASPRKPERYSAEIDVGMRENGVGLMFMELDDDRVERLQLGILYAISEAIHSGRAIAEKSKGGKGLRPPGIWHRTGRLLNPMTTYPGTA